MPTNVLVSDTNIWIDLHRGGLLEIAFSLPYQFVTTDFAWRELRSPPGADLEAMGLLVQALSSEAVGAVFALRETLRNPSLADMSCFYLAATHRWTLLTGDMAIRKACEEENMDVRGTLWLMDQLFAHGLVPGYELSESLQSILNTGGRLPLAECQSRIANWNRE